MAFARPSGIVSTLQKKEYAMYTTTHSHQKAISVRRAMMIAVIALLMTGLVAAYIRIMTAQTIAPPSLRILDFFWTTLSWLRA